MLTSISAKPAPADGEALFLGALPVLTEVLAFVCRRGRCKGDEAEEFGALVHLRLVESDYSALRRFDGRSSLKTYLTVVVYRLFIDFRRQRWGVWRPSAEARRLGDTAVRLDVLLHRDGLSLEESVEVLRTNPEVSASAGELRALAARLPARVPRRREGEDGLAELSIDAQQAIEGPALADERTGRVQQIRAALRDAMEPLSSEDAIVLRLRFAEGFTVQRIAELLKRPAKPLYRLIEKRLIELRRALQGRGFDAQDLAELEGDPGFDVEPGETSRAGPSKPYERP